MQLPSEFVHRMQTILGEEYPAFVEGYKLPLRRGLRINTHKISIAAFLDLFPHPLTPSPFAEDSFYLDAEHKAGSDPLHHVGAYYMQEPSAASAVEVLQPQPGEWVLDLCAAPGGKSTQIAAALGDTGLLWSNEYVPARARILQQNIERWGVRNSVISNQDTDVLCSGLANRFDAVLVDAPCSGEGMFRKEPQALTEWTLDNVLLCAARQKEILGNAAKAVKPGGRLVYSTCTFAPEENEGVVADFLTHHPDFELVPITVAWGRPGFTAEQVRSLIPTVSNTWDLTGCRRIFPQHGGEGHFIAHFRRAGEALPAIPPHSPIKPDPMAKEARELYTACFSDEPDGNFITIKDQIRLIPSQLPDCTGLGVLSAGVAVASVCKNRLEPHHSIYLATSANRCRQTVRLSLNDPRLTAYLHGEEILCDVGKGWTAVCVENIPVGFGKASGGKLKNRYPKGLRLL